MSANANKRDLNKAHQVTGSYATQKVLPDKQLWDVSLNETLHKVASQLELVESDLLSWLTNFTQAPNLSKLSLLQLMQRYRLNPFFDEISLVQIAGHWRPYISIDGWTKILHQQPSFAGITFADAPEIIDGIPLWLECTIYRSDQVSPTTVREYFGEVVTEHVAWKAMPRRMLRHRTMQQAIRLAFGVSGSSAIEGVLEGVTQSIEAKDRMNTAEHSPRFLPQGVSKRQANCKEPVSQRIDLLKDVLGVARANPIIPPQNSE